MNYFLNEEERKASGSTCYFEFQKGKHRNKFWLEDSICIHADLFDELLLFRLFSESLGDFDYYDKKRRERLAAAAAESSPAPVKKPEAAVMEKPKKKKALSWAEERELEGMEEAISKAEERIAELESVFSEPDFYAKHANDQVQLQQELEKFRGEAARLYERWEELEIKKNSATV